MPTRTYVSKTTPPDPAPLCPSYPQQQHPDADPRQLPPSISPAMPMKRRAMKAAAAEPAPMKKKAVKAMKAMKAMKK